MQQSQPAGQAVDAGVQKRTDHRAKHPTEYQQHPLDSAKRIHRIQRPLRGSGILLETGFDKFTDGVDQELV